MVGFSEGRSLLPPPRWQGTHCEGKTCVCPVPAPAAPQLRTHRTKLASPKKLTLEGWLVVRLQASSVACGRDTTRPLFTSGISLHTLLTCNVWPFFLFLKNFNFRKDLVGFFLMIHEMSGIPFNKQKGAPNTWPFHTSSWRRAWQENDEKGEPPTYVLEMKWEALKSLAFQKSWDLPLPVLRGYSVCGSLIRLQSAKSQPLRELPIRYASKETWVYYSFQSQVQLKLTKLTPHLTILNSDRGIASIFY